MTDCHRQVFPAYRRPYRPLTGGRKKESGHRFLRKEGFWYASLWLCLFDRKATGQMLPENYGKFTEPLTIERKSEKVPKP